MKQQKPLPTTAPAALGPLQLIRLADTCAIGSALMAAAQVGQAIPIDRSVLIEELDRVQPESVAEL